MLLFAVTEFVEQHAFLSLVVVVPNYGPVGVVAIVIAFPFFSLWIINAANITFSLEGFSRSGSSEVPVYGWHIALFFS